jgi:hypothetical protein
VEEQSSMVAGQSARVASLNSPQAPRPSNRVWPQFGHIQTAIQSALEGTDWYPNLLAQDCRLPVYEGSKHDSQLRTRWVQSWRGRRACAVAIRRVDWLTELTFPLRVESIRRNLQSQCTHEINAHPPLSSACVAKDKFDRRRLKSQF